jgi:hypothetical protein
MPVSEDNYVVAAKDQVSGDLADEDVVILNLKDNTYYGLDPVGGRVWSLIRQPRRVAEVRDQLLAEFDVDAERCTRELLALLEDLAAHGLIEVSAAPPA